MQSHAPIVEDITSELPQDILDQYPALREHARSVVLWGTIESLRFDLTRPSISHRGGGKEFSFGTFFISDTGTFSVFAGKKGFWEPDEWTWSECWKTDDLVVQLDCNHTFSQYAVTHLFNPEVNTEVTLRLAMLPSDEGWFDWSVAPILPNEKQFGDTLFRLPNCAAKSRIGDLEQERPVLIGRQAQATVLHFSTSGHQKVEEKFLPDDQYLGSFIVSGEKNYLWWDGKKPYSLTIAAEFQSWLDHQLPQSSLTPLALDTATSHPVLIDTCGLLEQIVLAPQDCICVPLDHSGNIKLIERGGKTHSLSPALGHYAVNGGLAFVSEEKQSCIVLKSTAYDGLQLAKYLSIQCDDYPFDENTYLMFIQSLENGEEESNMMPAVAGLDAMNFKSRISSYDFDVSTNYIHRQEEGCYWIQTGEGKLLKAMVDPMDDLRLRRSTMHTQVIERLEASPSMAELYGILNELQLNKFIHQLFGDLQILYQEMEKDPKPQQLLQKIYARNGEVELNKEVCSNVLTKLVVLANSLPDLKRQLERLGTLYPYFVQESDDNWLTVAFGESVAKNWKAQRGQLEIEKIRSFVRTTQGGLWRSLTEIERNLSKLEPVYSSRLKSTHKKAFNQKLIVTGGVGGASFLLTGTPILPALQLINMVNVVFSHYENNKQNQAILNEYGVEVLQWWQVFIRAFSVQVHESKNYLTHMFESYAKRDCDFFKKVPTKDRQQFLIHLKEQLQLRIKSESTDRFQFLMDGENQVCQDVIESLHKHTIKDSPKIMEQMAR